MNASSCGLSKSLKRSDLYLSRRLTVYFSSLTAENPRSLARINLGIESERVCSNDENSLSRWSSVIVRYFRANQYNEVLGVYLNLRQRNIGIQSSAIIFGLKSCVELRHYEFGRCLHTDAFKCGLSYDQFVCSSLIGFYAKNGRIGEASKVFEGMLDRDVVAYTSMITGYAHAGDRYANEAFGVARYMQRDGFVPNRVTLVSLLQCALRLGALNVGKSIHGYAIIRQLGFGDEVFETSLMDMYVKCGDLEACSAIFDKMKKTSSGSWNALMAGCLRFGQPLEALNLFSQMVSSKIGLDLIALANALLISADLGYLLIGKTIHGNILRKGVNLDLVGTTALVDMYCKCKHIPEATTVFNRAKEKDNALFNVMISGHLYNGRPSRAIMMCREMIGLSIKLNTSTIIHVLSAVSEMKDVRAGKSVHGYVFRRGLETNTDISNQFVNIYAKCGFVKYSRLVFDMIKLKDRVSWTSIMAALVNHNLADEAINSFHLMQRENNYPNPDSVTFTCLLQALNQMGYIILSKEVHGRLYRSILHPDVTLLNSLITAYSRHGRLKLACNVFNHMPERHLSTWNTMISAYGMHGDFIHSRALFDEMTKQNLAPDGVTFKAILSACSHTGFVEEGLKIFSSMEEEYGISPSGEHYGCIVDMLARGGRLEEAYDLLKQVLDRENSSALRSLLAACRIHGDSKMGEKVGKLLLNIDQGHTSAYCSVSNFYAGEGKWDEVVGIGADAEEKGFRRVSGYSLVESAY